MSTTRTLAFEERLLPMIIGAAKGHRTRRRRIRLIALTGATLTIATISIGSAVGGDHVVSIAASDAIEDPAGVERQLHAAGIDATVVVVPIAPEAKGIDDTWLWLHFDGPAAMTQHDFANIYRQVGSGMSTGLTESELDHGRGVGHMPILDLPADLPGHITLFAANVAPDGGTPWMWNELSPVGMFWCDGFDPDDPHAIGSVLSKRGFDITWRIQDESDAGPWVVNSPPVGTVVTAIWLDGPRDVFVELFEAGPDAHAAQRDEGTRIRTDAWIPDC